MTGVDLRSRLGIFERTFRRNTPAEVADAVIGAGYALAHWNFAAIGRSTLAAEMEDNQFTAVHTAFESAGLGIPSVSTLCWKRLARLAFGSEWNPSWPMLCGMPARRGVCWMRWAWTRRLGSSWIRPTSSPPTPSTCRTRSLVMPLTCSAAG